MGDEDDLSGLESLARLAGSTGFGMVKGPLQGMVREQVVQLVSNREPSDLRGHIVLRTNLVDEELPDSLKSLLAQYGPKFGEEIREYVDHERVLQWLRNPESWADEDTDPEIIEGVEEAAEVIEETDGGVDWLEWQCHEIHRIAGVCEEG